MSSECVLEVWAELAEYRRATGDKTPVPLLSFFLSFLFHYCFVQLFHTERFIYHNDALPLNEMIKLKPIETHLKTTIRVWGG